MNLQRFVLTAALVLGFMTASASDSGEDAVGTVLTEADSANEVSLSAGEEFVVRLGSNPSTGYQWEIAEMSVPDIAEFQLRSYEDADNTEVVGAAGFEVFTFEAGSSGAGILRLEYVRSFEELPVPDRVVEYIIRIDGAAWPPLRDTSEVRPLATATAPTSPANEPGGDVIDVSMLVPGEVLPEATVRGAVVWDRGRARLCELLLESFPAQCGGTWVVIANPDRLTVEMDSAGDVRWTPSHVEIAGRFDGERFIVDFNDETIKPTPADVGLVDAFVVLAANPASDTVNAVAFAETVMLGLGPDIMRTVDRDGLADAAMWSIAREEFRGYAGPFSALDLVSEPFAVTLGAHARCVAPPEPAPDGLEDHRRVSMQPTTATSCLGWWTIDFFIDDAGQIEAVTLDLFGP